jgi:signal transduction histidine kinase
LLGIFRDITERKKYLDEIEHSHQQMHALAERLITIREEEQTRIARELHDQLGHALTGLKMDLNWINNKMPIISKDECDQIHDRIKSMSKITDDTVKSVRNISAELRPGMLDNLGFIPTLEWELEQFKKRTGIHYTLDSPTSIPLDPNRGTLLYRIIQEVLTNIIRHAQANEVKVNIYQRDPSLIIEIADNGKGIDKTQFSDSHSIGLLGIRERAKLLGGTASNFWSK